MFQRSLLVAWYSFISCRSRLVRSCFHAYCQKMSARTHEGRLLFNQTQRFHHDVAAFRISPAFVEVTQDPRWPFQSEDRGIFKPNLADLFLQILGPAGR